MQTREILQCSAPMQHAKHGVLLASIHVACGAVVCSTSKRGDGEGEGEMGGLCVVAKDSGGGGKQLQRSSGRVTEACSFLRCVCILRSLRKRVSTTCHASGDQDSHPATLPLASLLVVVTGTLP